jgi:mRNA interferase MazF
VQRGEIWWASLSTPRESEPGYRRPVLVIQSNAFTASRIQTVLAVVLTSNLDLAAAPGNLIIRRKQSGLTRDSVVNVSQVVTLNKSFLTERVGALSPKLMNAVDEGLRLVLGL